MTILEPELESVTFRVDLNFGRYLQDSFELIGRLPEDSVEDIFRNVDVHVEGRTLVTTCRYIPRTEEMSDDYRNGHLNNEEMVAEDKRYAANTTTISVWLNGRIGKDDNRYATYSGERDVGVGGEPHTIYIRATEG